MIIVVIWAAFWLLLAVFFGPLPGVLFLAAIVSALLMRL